MTCSERLQAELQEDPGGGPPLIPVDPPDPPSSPRDQDLAGGIEAKGALSKGNLAYHVVQTFRLLCSLVYCMSGCPCEAHAAICHGLSSVLCNVSIITPAQCLLSRTRIELSMNLRKDEALSPIKNLLRHQTASELGSFSSAQCLNIL